MRHRTAAPGTPITEEDHGSVLEVVGPATLLGPPAVSPSPGRALPGFRVTIAALSGAVTIHFAGDQTTVVGGLAEVVVPANEARELLLLSQGKWLVR